jgi:ABC-type bacteriocin/lantibiotic exporter with double-glycine peptidase domain
MRGLVVGLCLVAVAAQAARAQTTTLVDTDPLCGAYCLYVALGSLEAPLPPAAEFFEQLGEPPPAGFSLGELAEQAEGLGLHTLGVQTSYENLSRRPERFACIAYLNRGHFVLLSKAADGMVTLVDPPRTTSVSREALDSQWDGTALLISNGSLLAEEDLPRPVNWLLWGLVGGAVAVLAGSYAVWRRSGG